MSHRVLLTGVAEDDLNGLGFDNVQKAHALDLAMRLEDLDQPEEIVDLDIRQFDHFYEVRQLIDSGGPLRSRQVQLRFGVVEKEDGDIVVLQITDDHENPDAIEMVVLEDRYRSYLNTGVARVLVDSAI